MSAEAKRLITFTYVLWGISVACQSVLIAISVKENRCSTFIFKLQCLLAMIPVLLISETALLSKMISLAIQIDDSTQQNKAVLVLELVRYSKSFVALNFCANLLALLVFWLFAVKYWIVAKKLELFRQEIRFESKIKYFSRILFGGAAAIVIFSLAALIPEFILFTQIGINAAIPTIAVCVVTLFISIIFLIDGFRRMNKVLTEGECINRKLVILISLTYLLIAVYYVVVIANTSLTLNQFINQGYYLVVVYVTATTTLATVVYKLGVDQAEITSQEQFEMLVEDDPVLNGSIS